MNILDEYRRNAQECQRMADNAGNPADKASWLRLAASWLSLIKSSSSRMFGHNAESEHQDGGERVNRAWPEPSDEDSKRSH